MFTLHGDNEVEFSSIDYCSGDIEKAARSLTEKERLMGIYTCGECGQTFFSGHIHECSTKETK